jgi:hypothetical protein
MVAGLSDLTAATLPLAGVAVAMVALDLYVLDRLLRERPRPPVSTFVLGGGVLVAQLVLWAGVGYYLFVPTVGGFVLFAIAAQFMMAPIGIWFVSLILQQSRRAIVPGSLPVALALGLLLFGNEYLMSIAFLPVAPPAFAGTVWFTGNPIEFLAAPLVTLWYCWPMAVTMATLLLWTRLPTFDASALGALTATAFVAPWIAEEPLTGAIAMTLLMTAGLLLLVRSSLQDRRPAEHAARMRLGVALSFGVMSAGAFCSVLVPSGPGHVLPFACASAGVMIGETTYLARRLLSQPVDVREASPVPAALPSPEA